MHQAHQILLYIHVFIGALALIIFWVPIATRKGGRWHVQSGKAFVWGMWAVGVSGVIMSVIVWMDPLAIRFPDKEVDPAKAVRFIAHQKMISEFLFMLSLLVLHGVKHSILVLKVKADRQALKSWHHLGLMIFLLVTALFVGIKGLVQNQILLLIFAPIALLNAINGLRYTFKAQVKQREWIIEHFSNILGCGIAVYTAFFAFGGRTYFEQLLPGMWQVLPWVLPGVIGVAMTFLYKPRYQKKYRVTADS